jgi:hypothetical protein
MLNENGEQAYYSVLGHVLTAAADVFGRPVRACDNFFDLGGDSVAAVDIVARLATALNVEPDADALISATDLGAFARSFTFQARP